MTGTPKGKPDKPETAAVECDTWADDQNSKGYYYDDSHGYETYSAEMDDEEAEPVDPSETPRV